MSKPFKMRSGNSPIFKRIGGSSPVRAVPDPAGEDFPTEEKDYTLTDEQVSDYLGETKQDIREQKRIDLARSRRQQKYATGSRSGKKVNINLNPLSIITGDTGRGHFGITTSQVRKVTDPKKRRQFKRQLKKKHRSLRSDIKKEARHDIDRRKEREKLVKEHYKHYNT